MFSFDFIFKTLILHLAVCEMNSPDSRKCLKCQFGHFSVVVDKALELEPSSNTDIFSMKSREFGLCSDSDASTGMFIFKRTIST